VLVYFEAFFKWGVVVGLFNFSFELNNSWLPVAGCQLPVHLFETVIPPACRKHLKAGACARSMEIRMLPGGTPSIVPLSKGFARSVLVYFEAFQIVGS